jgi:hypothetical protein
MPKKSIINEEETELPEKGGETYMSWQFPEYNKYVKTKWWYITAIIIGIGLLIYAIWNANYLFAIIVILSALIIFIHDYRTPRLLNFKIKEGGIYIGKVFYPYNEINNFWIIYDPPEVKFLYFNFKSFFQPNFAVPLLDRNPIKAREILLNFLEEDLSKEDEGTEEHLSRVLKIR